MPSPVPERPASLLSVGLDRDAFDRFQPMLARALLAVHRVKLGCEAFEVLDTREFDLLMVGYPLPDVRLDDFLAIVRRPGSANAAARVVVLDASGPGTEVEAASAAGDDRRLSVISLERPPVETLTEVATHLGLAQRLHKRMLVRLEIEADDRREARVMQSENISETGMLVRTENPYAVASRLLLRFDLPSGDRIEAEALVVRHAKPDLEGLSGMGLRFAGLRSTDRERLREYLSVRSGGGRHRR